ncbi:MAG: hypothetical protein WEE20_04210, partial [Bacteroidota bacterium]
MAQNFPTAPPESVVHSDSFDRFRRNIVGHDQLFRSPYGEKRLVYADWTASGRLYEPIERKLHDLFG